VIGRWWGLARSLVMYYGQPWKRRRMERMYARFVKPGDLCFDVGAHVGNRVRCFLDLGARVVAVEPQPLCLEVLRRGYGGRPDVTILPVGLSDRPGTATLHVSTRTPTVSTLDAGWIAQVTAADARWAAVAWDERVEVEVRTLDDLVRDHGEPDFVKIDVEGLELQVLQGLSTPVRACSFEYLPPAKDRALACVDHLESLAAYAYSTSVGESHTFGQEAPWTAAEVRAFLAGLQPGDPSGDVYAVRVG
jgi:FkbM family methyltransferase